MDNCPIHTHLNIDVAIGLDLARTLPSTRAKNVITESKRWFIHVTVVTSHSSILLMVPCNLILPSTFCPSLGFIVGIISDATEADASTWRRARGTRKGEVFLFWDSEVWILGHCYCWREAAGEQQLQVWLSAFCLSNAWQVPGTDGMALDTSSIT